MVRRWLALILGLVVLAAAPSAAQEQPSPTGAPSEQTDRDDAFGFDDLLPGNVAPAPAADPITPETWEEQVDRFYERYGDDMWTIPIEVEEEVLDLLFLEIALLDEVDGFTAPGHPRVARIHAEYAPWPDVARLRYVDALFRVDDQLADLKNDIVALLGEAPPQVVGALDEIRADQRDRLRAGTTAVVPSPHYMGAVSMFLSHGVSDELVAAGDGGLEFELFFEDALFALADRGDLDVVDDTGAPATDAGPAPGSDETASTAVDTVAAADPPGGSAAGAGGGSRATWIVVALIAALGVAIGWAGGVVVLRRRRRPGDDPRATELVLEAHRRLSGAREESVIGATAAEFAARLTGAGDALVLRRVPDGLRPAGQTQVFAGTVLDRVVETAQSHVGPVDADPLVGGPVEICAVPMVADARITGVLVARRPAGQPFPIAAGRTLERLAPAVAAALVGADELDAYEHLALVDGLTSLGNRRRLDGDLETAVSDAIAGDRPVAFAMIDVDHFKTFNDTHGHEAGDAALRTVARIIESTVRSDDVVYRYGGEEFSVLLPGASPQEAAQVAERIRLAVEAARIEGEESQPGGRLTVSVGLAQLDADTPHDLKRHADTALYEAKARGRNRCISA